MLLPTQLGKFIFLAESYIAGIRVDYLAIKIYSTDVLIIMLLVVAAWNRKKNISKWIQRRNKRNILVHTLILGALYTTLWILPSVNKITAMYQSMKLLEYTLLATYVIVSKIKLKALIPPLSIGIFLESIIALSQWVRQESLDGLLYWVGERTYYSTTPGIALVDIFGTLYLRPYATFTHPNVLGGFLSIGLSAIVFVIVTLLKNPTKQKRRIIILIIWYAIGFLALLLTFSTSAIMTHIIGVTLICVYLWKQPNTAKFLKYASFSVLGGLLLIGSLLSIAKWSSPQVIKDQNARGELNKIATQMILERPIIGGGLNSFLSNVQNYKRHNATERTYQPVHNIYLLLAAETGIIGSLIVFALLLKCFAIYVKEKTIRSTKWIGLVLLVQLLIIGFVDHYFLTIQQGQLIVVFVISLAFLPKTSYT